jgi:hypothetical protein
MELQEWAVGIHQENAMVMDLDQDRMVMGLQEAIEEEADQLDLTVDVEDQAMAGAALILRCAVGMDHQVVVVCHLEGWWEEVVVLHQDMAHPSTVGSHLVAHTDPKYEDHRDHPILNMSKQWHWDLLEQVTLLTMEVTLETAYLERSPHHLCMEMDQGWSVRPLRWTQLQVVHQFLHRVSEINMETARWTTGYAIAIAT